LRVSSPYFFEIHIRYQQVVNSWKDGLSSTGLPRLQSKLFFGKRFIKPVVCSFVLLFNLWTNLQSSSCAAKTVTSELRVEDLQWSKSHVIGTLYHYGSTRLHLWLWTKRTLWLQKNDVPHVVEPHQLMVNANVFMKLGTRFFMSANIMWPGCKMVRIHLII